MNFCFSTYRSLILTLNLPVLLTFIFISTVTMADEAVLNVLKGNNDFAVKLYNAVASVAKPNENLFMSPISAHTILSLVYQGAKLQTEQELATVLGLPSKELTAAAYGNISKSLNEVKGVTLNTANKVFLAEKFPLKEKFAAVATNNYAAGTELVDFNENVKAAKIINGWVEEKTMNKIKDLIRPDMLDALTAMVLVNAIYFKGLWLKQFQASNTQKKDFYISETEKQECDMMYQKSRFRYADNQELDAQILELPYQGNEISMLIILPKTKTGIVELEKKLSNINLATLTENLFQQEVEVHLPKFKIEYTVDLTKILKKMGLTRMFSDAAEFHDISEVPLKVSEAIQKAFIEVNEEGTEAAAATGAIMMMRCMPIPKPVINFMADHPFYIVIQQVNNNVANNLFQGRIVSIE